MRFSPRLAQVQGFVLLRDTRGFKFRSRVEGTNFIHVRGHVKQQFWDSQLRRSNKEVQAATRRLACDSALCLK